MGTLHQLALRFQSAPFVRGSDTSREAAESLDTATLNALQSLILRVIVAAPGGMTCDEAEVRLNLKHQTASARIKELKDMGRIVDSGWRRCTRSGRSAVVYVKGA